MAIASPPPEIDEFPTHLDLPDTDGKPVENAYQPAQSALLTGCLTPMLNRFHPDGDYFIGEDMGIYWRRTKNPLEGCKVPDWFYVPGAPRLLDGTYRRSYVMWHEYAHPLIAIEYVSGDGLQERDATPYTGKFWVYERIIQPIYYLIHDPDREELNAWELVRGRYKALEPTPEGRYRIQPLEVDFGIWEGEYLDVPANWLRVWDTNGQLIPSPQEMRDLEHQKYLGERVRAEQEKARAEQEKARAEQEKARAEQEKARAEQEKARAEQEKARAEQEKARAERLAARLRELGVNPDVERG